MKLVIGLAVLCLVLMPGTALAEDTAIRQAEQRDDLATITVPDFQDHITVTVCHYVEMPDTLQGLNWAIFAVADYVNGDYVNARYEYVVASNCGRLSVSTVFPTVIQLIRCQQEIENVINYLDNPASYYDAYWLPCRTHVPIAGHDTIVDAGLPGEY